MFRKLLPVILVLQLLYLTMDTAFPQEGDPTIVLSSTNAYICPGDSAIIEASINGQMPVWLKYEAIINGNPVSDSLFSNSNPIIVSFKTVGTYRIVAYGDNAPKTVNETIELTVSQAEAPSAILSGGGNFCYGEVISPINIVYTGTAPWQLTYQRDYGNAVTEDFTQNSAVLAQDNAVIILHSVSDRYCTADLNDTLALRIFDLRNIAIGGSNEFCAGDSWTYTTTYNDFYRYSWRIIPVNTNYTEQSNNLLVLWEKPGEYNLILFVQAVNTECTSDTVSLPIHVYKVQVSVNDFDTTVCFFDNPQIVLKPGKPAENSIYWLHSGDTSDTAIISEAGTYSYVESIPLGCSDTASIRVTEKCIPHLYVPEAFTPNGDGINDELLVFGNFYNLRLFIYTGNGELVYSMMPGASPWDGTGNDSEMPNATYYWKAHFTDRYGEPYQQEGQTVLIR